ncbi:polysaccharide deacetylase family protein [Roseivirga sp.]|uniref:polysaccharide deacetylase family protein n=1 Tax=Roseivirga sp. TaxID=1964215 RepID=UPI003B8ABCB1
MRNILLTLFLLLFCSNLNAQKRVCITIDDLPVVSYGMDSKEALLEVTEKLINNFQKHNIPAIGYVNENKLYTKGELNDFSVSLLEKWLASGYELGNHTFSHMDYHANSFATFSEDFLKGEKVIKPLALKYNSSVKYFRHPFLRSGETKEKSEELEAFLKEKNYLAAPVTLDSDDYLFAQAYAKAYKKKDEGLMKKIGEAYIDHTEKKLKFYEKMSEGLFKRDIAQIYLMHASLLNADYSDELYEMFEKNGYSFISQTEALADKAYQEPITKFGKWGISWLYRWAMTKGRQDLMKNEVELPGILK